MHAEESDKNFLAIVVWHAAFDGDVWLTATTQMALMPSPGDVSETDGRAQQ